MRFGTWASFVTRLKGVGGEAFQRNVNQAELDQEVLRNVLVREPEADHPASPNAAFQCN